MSDFSKIETVLNGCTAAGSATEDMITSAEKTLGVVFPASYREFLRIYGAVVCEGFSIAGLSTGNFRDAPPLWSDVVTSTMQLRRWSSGHLPEAYVAIADDGGDYKFYLDTSRLDDEGECRVVVMGPGADAVNVADDFVDFLVRFAQDAIVF